MNGAIESSYFGSHAGQIIRFTLKHEELFFVVGLYANWIDKNTGEIKQSFTLITDDPYPFFFNCGHDRSVFCIDNKAITDWLFNNKMSAQTRFNFLRQHRVDQNWQVHSEREMKKGWEKRAPSSSEIKAIKIWQAANS